MRPNFVVGRPLGRPPVLPPRPSPARSFPVTLGRFFNGAAERYEYYLSPIGRTALSPAVQISRPLASRNTIRIGLNRSIVWSGSPGFRMIAEDLPNTGSTENVPTM
jgi:hypothetical protein